MYLRHTTIRKNGKVHRYWRLGRSVRVGRRVIQQTVAHLGELDERGRIEARALARHLIGAPEATPLFDDGIRAARCAIALQPDSCPAGFRLTVTSNYAFDDWAAISEGAYLLRSIITDRSDQQLSKADIQLTQPADHLPILMDN